MTQKINFEVNADSTEKLERVFRQNSLGLSIAEIHGTLTGLVCIGQNETNFHQWQPLLFPKIGAKFLLNTMFSLTSFTKRRLESFDFQFKPILGSSSELVKRTELLSDWCRGFTIGVSWNGINQAKNSTEDTEIFLSDIVQISLAEVGSDDSEIEEKAFFELEEYVKVGVQLVYEEYLPEDLTRPGAG